MGEKKVTPSITVDQLNALLRLDKATNKLYWRITRNGRVKAGDAAGFYNTNQKCRCVNINYREYLVPTVIHALTYGAWPVIKSTISGIRFLSSGNYKALIRVKGKDIIAGTYIEVWDAICARKSLETVYRQ